MNLLYSAVTGCDRFGWFVEWRTRSTPPKVGRRYFKTEDEARRKVYSSPPAGLAWLNQKRLPL